MVNSGECVKDVHCTEDKLTVDLAAGRSISVPLAWYPLFLYATPRERDNWAIAGAGFGVYWPELDEDLSVDGLLRGGPSPRAKALSTQRRHLLAGMGGRLRSRNARISLKYDSKNNCGSKVFKGENIYRHLRTTKKIDAKKSL